ncbi:TIR domain-containing protein [Sediminibacterium salmoneum]|uniref:TIR domain-containing protein n=1 Tax=Sediminibacterium salmoneum TaxID=426421 RepID=UPI000479368D|nr:TIR domain-containing protein [Sediminibacterium salmoneum]
MAKKKVFVSFDYDDDKNYRNLLKAWDANPEFDFYISDLTPGEIDTWDVSRIKAALTASIRNATYTLVIIGKNANKRHPKADFIGYKNWINFEIAQSKANRNRLVAVKLDREYESPNELLGANASWAMSFTKDSIINALNEASRK